MTAAELIKQLQQYPPNYQVRVYHPNRFCQYRVAEVTLPRNLPRTVFIHVPKDI